MADLKIEGETPHPNHIPKGATFEIGDPKITDLKKLPRDDRELVARLLFSHSIADGNDPKVVAAVQEEIEIEQRSQASTAALDKKLKAETRAVFGAAALSR